MLFENCICLLSRFFFFLKLFWSRLCQGPGFKAPKDHRTNGRGDRRTRGPEDYRTKRTTTTGAEDHRTRGVQDQRTRGPQQQRSLNFFPRGCKLFFPGNVFFPVYSHSVSRPAQKVMPWQKEVRRALAASI